MDGWVDGYKKSPYFFLILRHIRHYPHILLKYILNVCLYEFRMGFKFWLSWGLDAKIQNYPLEWIFFFFTIVKVDHKNVTSRLEAFLQNNTPHY